MKLNACNFSPTFYFMPLTIAQWGNNDSTIYPKPWHTNQSMENMWKRNGKHIKVTTIDLHSGYWFFFVIRLKKLQISYD